MPDPDRPPILLCSSSTSEDFPSFGIVRKIALGEGATLPIYIGSSPLRIDEDPAASGVAYDG